VHLEANDITEITYQRLLSKSEQGEAALKALWATHCPALRLATSLEGVGSLQTELQEKDFVNLYPFLPTTFQMLVRLLGRLAKKTGGTGLRSASNKMLPIRRKLHMEQLKLPFEGDLPPGYVWIYRPWVTDPKTGRRRYPKHARFFRFRAKAT
jgi:hypothetical protein